MQGAALATAVFGASAGPIGAVIGAVIAIYESVPHASADNRDTRLPVIQVFDTVPYPQDPPDPLVTSMTNALVDYEFTRGMVGESFGSGPLVTWNDVANKFNILSAFFERQLPGQGVAKAESAIELFEAWNTHPCDAPDPNQFPSILNPSCPTCFAGQQCWFSPYSDPSLRVGGRQGTFDTGDIDTVYRLAQAAVMQWDVTVAYSYIVGMRMVWENADRAFGTNTPHSDLDARIGYLATKIPGLSGIKIIGINGGGPHNLPGIVYKNQPAAPSSTAATVAKGAAVVGVAAVVGTGLYAWITHQAYGRVWGKIWDETGGKVVKQAKRLRR